MIYPYVQYNLHDSNMICNKKYMLCSQSLTHWFTNWLSCEIFCSQPHLETAAVLVLVVDRWSQTNGCAHWKLKFKHWQLSTKFWYLSRCTTCGEYIYKGKKFNARKVWYGTAQMTWICSCWCPYRTNYIWMFWLKGYSKNKIKSLQPVLQSWSTNGIHSAFRF